MNALQERNERVKYAKTLGIKSPQSLKKDALAAAIAEAEAQREQALKEQQERVEELTAERDEDGFDPINPELEGDHLPEAQTLTAALGERDATREAWLNSAVEALETVLAPAGGVVRRELVSISVGFPSKNIRKRIGECWTPAASVCGTRSNIFISPLLDNPIAILGTILHELIHHSIHHSHPEAAAHGAEFKAIATAVGLEGKMTATTVGPVLAEILKEVAEELGPYPHTRIQLGGGAEKKQTTRMLKAECPDLECPFTTEFRGKMVRPVVRLTRMWVEAGATPTCACGETMQVQQEEEGE